MSKKKQNKDGMHPEIERKFLVLVSPPEMYYAEEYVDPLDLIKQVYLLTDFPTVVRIRVVTRFGVTGLAEEPPKAFLTIKTRPRPEFWQGQEEFEREIPLAMGMAFINRKDLPRTEKLRKKIGDFDFDRFCSGPIDGLQLLEIELSDPKDGFVIPEGFEVIEVTNDARFRNENLAQIKTRENFDALIASVVRERRNVTT